MAIQNQIAESYQSVACFTNLSLVLKLTCSTRTASALTTFLGMSVTALSIGPDLALNKIRNRGRSPLLHVDAEHLTKACVCFLETSNIAVPTQQPAPDNPRKAKPGICNKHIAKTIRKAFYEPVAFCNFYKALTRTSSPIPGLTSKDLLNGCECIKEVDASLSSSSDSIPSTTKASSKSSIKHTTTTTIQQASTTFFSPITCNSVPSTIMIDVATQSSITTRAEAELTGFGPQQTVPFPLVTASHFNSDLPATAAVASCVSAMAPDFDDAIPDAMVGVFKDYLTAGEDATGDWRCQLFSFSMGNFNPGRNDSIACAYFYEIFG